MHRRGGWIIPGLYSVPGVATKVSLRQADFSWHPQHERAENVGKSTLAEQKHGCALADGRKNM